MKNKTNRKRPTQPTQGLLQGCPYTPSEHTDITKTWRKYGWRPLAERKGDKTL